MTRKERTAELVKQLRDAAARQEPLARAAVELVKLSIEELKDSLVTADGDDMMRKQGAARQLSSILRELTHDPLAFKTPGVTP